MRFQERCFPYVFAIASTAIALLLSLWLQPLLLRNLDAFFYTATVISAWYGGCRSGIVTVILDTLAINYFFIPPLYQLTIAQPINFLQLSTFSLIGLIINFLTSNFRDSKKKIERLNQQLLQEKADLLGMASSAAQVGMRHWDIATGRIQCSADYEQLFGLTPGTFDGRYETFLTYLYPEDRELVDRALQQTIQNKNLYQVEYRVVWADGSIHWIEERGHAFYNEAGEAIHVTGTATAIDRRKQAQGLLQETFEQQRLLMEVSQRIRQSLNLQEIFQTTVDETRHLLKTDRVIIFQFDPKWRGTVVAESVGTNWRAILSTEIYDPCFSEQYVEPYKQGFVTAKSDIYKAGINSCHLELLANFQVRANLVVPIVKGSELWGLLIAHHCDAPRQWNSSEIDLMRQLANQVSIAIQQSELFKQVQTELAERQQAETLLRLFVQYAPAGIAMFDRNMCYLMASQRWIDQYNLESIESLIGRSHYEIFPEIPPRWREIHQRCLAGAIEKSEEDFLIRANGIKQWEWWEVHPWYTAKNEIGGIIIFSVDISNLKKIKMNLQQLNAELEQRVIDRTAELSEVNDRLQEVLIALQESEERRRLALDLTHIGFWDLYIPSRCVIWNDNQFRVLGFAPYSVDPSYEVWLNSVHPEDRSWLEERFLESVRNHTDYAAEYRVIHPDSSVHWVMARGKAIYDELGQPLRSIGVVLDISDRKRAEQALQQANAQLLQHKDQLEKVNQQLQTTVEELQIAEEELTINNQQLEVAILTAKSQQQRYEDLFNFAPDGYLVTDSLGMIQEANQAATNLLFVSSFNLVGKPLAIYISNENKQFFRNFLIQLQQLSGRSISELTILPRQGNSFPAEIAASAIRNEQGEIIGIRWLIKDISDRKQAEQALKESEAKFRSLCEYSPIGVFMTDIHGQCIYTNPHYQKICGSTFEELLGEGYIEFIHPEDQEVVLNQWLQAISQKQEFCSEFRYLHKGGIIRFVRVQSAPIPSGCGEIVGYVCTVEDITESRIIEQMKNEFISVVSHELRTPLASIRGSMGLLASGILKDKQDTTQQMLNIAIHDTERLVRLVNDILDLERLEARKVNLNKQRCDALTLMQQSVESLQPLALQNNITLSIEPTSIQVWADSDRIIQTLVNLIGNAIKFSPPHTTITLKVQNEADHILFQVQDRGRGIPADKLETIFGRFQQVDASDSRHKGGTGLGLAICKLIVQQHGGKIWVESFVGEGSTFYFTLPKFLD
ncbi:hypothetical protein NIES2119_10935 [[Phormidium ambiguum] IAM M-71]|uniref:histidine kinase n=1 Tax=[Phormidium ambiguum] IAM M-71 TaxID=454136 RepID=A0A1U7ILC3_9CYAN|nr:PAS domain S-box protein [Phormidium ambiguum]OKH38068.1 hypothetical protein NIES2119_10935 [Phormidium ambiguum IAM M-71]